MALTHEQQQSIIEAAISRFQKGKPPLFSERTQRLAKVRESLQAQAQRRNPHPDIQPKP